MCKPWKRSWWSESTLSFFTLPSFLTILEVKEQDGDAVTAISTIGALPATASSAPAMLAKVPHASRPVPHSYYRYFTKRNTQAESGLIKARPHEVRKQGSEHSPSDRRSWSVWSVITHHLGTWLAGMVRCSEGPAASNPVSPTDCGGFKHTLHGGASDLEPFLLLQVCSHPTQGGVMTSSFATNICLPGHEQPNTKAAS